MSNIPQAVLARREIRATNSAKKKELADQLRLEGNDMYNKKNYVEAANNYAKAVDIHGPKPLLMSNLAMTYLKLELYDDAEWAATTALKYDPRNIKARFRRAIARKGIASESMGQKGTEARYTAISDLQIIINEDPKCKDAKTELQSLLNEHQDFDDEYDVVSIDYEDFPGYHDEPDELISDSDTSECRHTGDGIPCRPYNRQGCAKASDCHHSHAPDDKSVRDELGRNVCLDFLIQGQCRLSSRKCPYSHDKTYLPSGGWWDDPDKTELRSTLMQVDLGRQGKGEKDIFLARSQLALERAAQRVQGEAASTSQSLAKPFVLLLSLDNEAFFADIHDHILSSLRDKLQVIQALTRQDALKHLSSPALAGVFVTDPGIADVKASAVVNKLVAYVKNGGSAVFAGLFSSFIRPGEFNEFFKNAWGLDWKFGSYFRTTFSLNPSNELAKRNSSLATSYSMKAVQVFCSSQEMALYGDFTSMPLKESPAVCVRVGRGLLSYLGDVNAETSSTNAVLAMLGLLDASNELLPPTSLPGAEITSNLDGSDGPLSKAKQKQTAKAPATQKASNRNQSSTIEPDAQKFMMVLSFSHADVIRAQYDDFFRELEAKVEVLHGLSNARIVDLLSSADLIGVFIPDSPITDRKNRYLLSKLVEYTESGGTIIFGALFCGNMFPRDVRPFFDNWGLPWESVDKYVEGPVSLNTTNSLVKKNPDLPVAFDSTEHYYLKGITPSMAVYVPAPDQPFQSAIIYAGVKKGHVGYIGMEHIDEAFTSIFCAMLGIS